MYKVGDKVRIRKDLKQGGNYGIFINQSMIKMAGKIVEISKIDKRQNDIDRYALVNHKWKWTAKMFEDLNKALWMDITRKEKDEVPF